MLSFGDLSQSRKLSNQPTHFQMVLQESAMAAEQIEDGELDFVPYLHLSHLFSWLNQSLLTNRVASRKSTHCYFYVTLKKDVLSFLLTHCLKRGVKFLHPWRLGIFFSGPRVVVEFYTWMGIDGRRYLIHPWKLTAGSPKNHPVFQSGKSSEPNLHDLGFQMYIQMLIFQGVFVHYPEGLGGHDAIIMILLPVVVVFCLPNVHAGRYDVKSAFYVIPWIHSWYHSDGFS